MAQRSLQMLAVLPPRDEAAPGEYVRGAITERSAP